jgi:hypothetical protein
MDTLSRDYHEQRTGRRIQQSGAIDQVRGKKPFYLRALSNSDSVFLRKIDPKTQRKLATKIPEEPRKKPWDDREPGVLPNCLSASERRRSYAMRDQL